MTSSKDKKPKKEVTDEARVLAHLTARAEEGATDDEIEVATGLSHQNASARRNTLVKKGLVKRREPGEKGKRETRSGRRATIWVLGKDDRPRARSPKDAGGEERARGAWAMALEAASELICNAAPVTWTGGLSTEAHEWEKRAKEVLAQVEEALGRRDYEGRPYCVICRSPLHTHPGRICETYVPPVVTG